MMWGYDYGAGGWAMMIGSLILSVIFIAAVVFGVVWLVRALRAAPIAGAGTSAQAILDARYARGEIDESELVQRRQVLAGGPPGGGTKT